MKSLRSFPALLCVWLAACSLSTPAAPTRTPALTPTSTPTPAPTATPAEAGWCSPPGRRPVDFLIIGYLPEYRTINKYWGNCLTDIIYFSAGPLADGGLDASRLDPATLQVMREMKAAYGTRLHLSIGGNERSDGFAPMVTDPAARQAFVENLVIFASQNSLDGIDLDWEFPEGADQISGYVALITGLQARGLLVSVTLYPAADLDPAPYTVADRVQVMSYDRDTRHATFEQAVADMEFFASGGIPKEKLVLGLPFYGRLMESPYTSYSYAEIVAAYQPPPELDEAGGIYFNGPSTTQKKACHARQSGYAGVMLWELGQDSTDTTSLLQAVYTALASQCLP
jgi:hypothetical protein